jgi:uncharacterized membrane protein
MLNFKLILTFLFASIMILGGMMHFINPQLYDPFIPNFLPKDLVNYVTGILEIVVGIGAIIPRYRSQGTLGILLLMLAFLPLHILDVFKDNPAIGSQQAALIRAPLQFLFILWAWFIHKK